MLYTVRPLERVYAQPSLFDQKNSDPKAMNAQEEEYREVLLPNGRIVTRRDGENFIIERLNSTNMKDYLNDEYVPGKSIKQ
jgi:hypothetical protein